MKTFNLLVPQPELGRTARELRESMGIGVEEMAMRLETTRQTIYNFESGQRQSMKILQGYLKLKGGVNYGYENK